MKPFRTFGKPLDRGQPRGISLLEVLISIGILSVGLMAAMSLIPLGRTHLQKAGVDDRAATVIPSAYETMLTMGLFNRNSLGLSLGPANIPEAAAPNDTMNQAQSIAMEPLGVTRHEGRDVFVERSSITIRGRLDGELPDLRLVNDTRPARDVDLIDCYRIPVEINETLTVTWSIVGTSDLKTDPTSGQVVAVSFGGPIQQPNNPDAGSASYAVPGDGFAYLKVERKLPPSPSQYDNIDYFFTVERQRADRVVAVDPLMAARLDKVLDLRIPKETLTASSAPAIRRRFFADFSSQAGAANLRALRIPRLTWQTLASPTVEEALALSDASCRLHDDLEVDDDVVNQNTGARDEYRPPRPDYVRDQTGAAWCRKSAGRMSWLLTLQPQAPGSVSTNWQPGSVFDVSIVIFQDRDLPALDPDAEITGEYAFPAAWSEREGMLFIEVTQPLLIAGKPVYLDDEDLRVLFRNGSWLLLAPPSDTNTPPVEVVQKLVWVRVQTVEFEKSRTNVVVRVLPETEPPPEVLPGVVDANGEKTVVAIVHRGVVAVVTKQVTIGP